MNKIIFILSEFFNYYSGNFAYQNYLKNFHLKKNCNHSRSLDNHQLKPLTKKQFLQQKINEKYRNINRCC